jgi:hypothetical protein
MAELPKEKEIYHGSPAFFIGTGGPLAKEVSHE